MNLDCTVLKPEEQLTLALRGLYERYGYKKYRMNRFEEYRLYMENKNFLVSESVISFTDLDGRLLALKPDVTLSVVKHAAESAQQRVYYIENVYRPDKAKRHFREIAQMGLECIGTVDDYMIAETLMLAAQSLFTVSNESLLEISHMGFVTGMLRAFSVRQATANELMRLIGEKNLHGIRETAEAAGLGNQAVESLVAVTALCGDYEEVMPAAKALCMTPEMTSAIEQLERLQAVLCKISDICHTRVDLSLLGEEDYYNGVIFGGYVNGVPAKVLSGGQYDRMMRKFGKQGGAIGFALYLSELERLLTQKDGFDCDYLVEYTPDVSYPALFDYINELVKQGKSVIPCPKGMESGIRSKEVLQFPEAYQKGVPLC